nr:MAG TPA: hypothetical protein [Bacteriophage sp.]
MRGKISRGKIFKSLYRATNYRAVEKNRSIF